MIITEVLKKGTVGKQTEGGERKENKSPKEIISVKNGAKCFI